MKYEDFAEQRLISDIAKGRYPKEKVRELLDLYAKACIKKAEENIFEYCWLTLLQELRFEAGYTKEEMEAFFAKTVDAVEAYYQGAYDLEEMRQVLLDEVGFAGHYAWRRKKVE